jgi:ankyrin repeat protein
MTPLHYAVFYEKASNFPMVRWFLSKQANMGIANTNGYTALHIAVARNESSLVKILLENAQLCAIHDGKMLIQLAKQYNCFNVFQLLLEAGVDSEALKSLSRKEWLALLKLIADQNTYECFELCQYLIEKFSKDIQLDQGMSILHIATAFRHLGMIKFSLAQGENPNKTNAFGWTALRYATLVEGKDTGEGKETTEVIVKYLLAQGADPNLYDVEDGISPLDEAIYYNLESITDLLLEHGADPNRIDTSGSNPLLRAVGLGRSVRIVKKLLEHGANIEHIIKEAEGESLLHLAVMTDNQFMKTIMENFSNEHYLKIKTPLGGCRVMIVKYLIEKGIDVNRKSFQGDTPLHYAVLYCKEGTTIKRIIYLLLKHGANPYEKNNEGQTAIDIASDELKAYILEVFTSLNTQSTHEVSFFKHTNQELNNNYTEDDLGSIPGYKA